MIRKIYDQVVEAISAPRSGEDPARREEAVRLATAVLMIDVATADHVFDEAEFDRVLRLVEKHFRLQPEQAAEIVNEAGEVAEDMVSVYEFTQLLHKNLDEEEKTRVVGLLWDIAYADGRLDRYEDSLVLKISDLLYVNRARVMRLKHDAGQRA